MKPDRSTARVVRTIGAYLTSYLLGIAAGLVLSPAEPVLAGVALWPSYLVLAPVGFVLFYFYLPPGYGMGSGAGHVVAYCLGLAPFVAEVLVRLPGRPRWRAWRPLWIGFPVGFVGTLGVYYTAAASI